MGRYINPYHRGDWVLHDGKPKKVDVVWSPRQVSLYDPSRVWGSLYADKYGIEEVHPIPLSPEVLAKNGWEHKGITWVLRSELRLGWNEKTHKFYLGYGELPEAVDYVHQLQRIYEVCSMDTEIRI